MFSASGPPALIRAKSAREGRGTSGDQKIV
jgi:hypothetical protein